MRRTFLRCMGLAGALLCGAASHAADPPWPAAKPIRLVVPGGAGSGSDIFARLIGARLGEALQQTIYYDNKAGANGIIGNDFVAKAPADGYTLLFSNASAVALNAVIQPKLPYRTLEDLVPVAQVGAGGVLLVVTPDVPVKDIKGFIQYVQAHPDELSYGTWGTGSTGNLAMEALKAESRLRISHVPYKTSAQVLTDLQGGILRVAFVDAASPVNLIKAGKLVALGVTGSHRVPAFPALPTVQEQGYQLGADGWYGVFAPAGTAPAIVQRLNTEINRILAAPAMRPTFQTWNMSEPPIKTPAEFAQTLRDDVGIWGAIARTGQFKVETPSGGTTK